MFESGKDDWKEENMEGSTEGRDREDAMGVEGNRKPVRFGQCKSGGSLGSFLGCS